MSWADLAIALVAPLIALLARDTAYFAREELSGLTLYVIVACTTTAVSLGYFGVGGILGEFLCGADMKRITKASVVGVLMAVAILFTINRLHQIPRSIPLLHVVFLAGLLVGWRLLLARIRGRRRCAGVIDYTAAGPENVILVGANRMALLYIRMIAGLDAPQPRVIALLDDDDRLHGRSIGGHQIVGRSAALKAVIEEYATHGVTINRIVLMVTNEAEKLAIAQRIGPVCADAGIELESWTDTMRHISKPRGTVDASAVEAATPNNVVTVHNPGYWRFRRFMDVVVSGVALVALSPFFVLVAALVVLDVGLPVIFWQERIGRYGRKIYVYKFRTLRLPLDPKGRPVSHDERISVIGRFLRAARLDELPQLFNILGGEMTIIGPRPLLPADQPRADRSRLAVPPGLTGWAQINGGRLISPEEKNSLDKWYVRYCGPALDLKILGLTLLALVRGDMRNPDVLRRAFEEEFKLQPAE